MELNTKFFVGYPVLIRLSKKVEYGLMSLIYLDERGRGAQVTTKEISDALSIPAEHLGKVLQKLAKAGFIESIQGAHGGYVLGRGLEQCDLGEVIEVLDGPVSLAKCQDEPTACDQFCNCNIKDPVQRIQTKLISYLHTISLAEFRESNEPATFEVEV